MILFDQVLQVLGPDSLDFGWAFKSIKDFGICCEVLTDHNDSFVPAG